MEKKPTPTEKVKELNKIIEQYMKEHSSKNFEYSDKVTGLIIVRFMGEETAGTSFLGNISIKFAIQSILEAHKELHRQRGEGGFKVAA